MPAWSAASSPMSAGRDRARSRSRPPSGRPCRRSAPCRRPAARPPRGPRSRRPTAPPPGRRDPSVEDDVDLDRRVAPRVEDLPGVDDRWRMRAVAFARLDGPPAGRSSSTVTPGSSRPSRNSSDAPPPVRMWVILSARPCCVIAATESPPPTTTVAPASARSARNPAIALVPWANEGISNTPSGPFQNTVRTSASASTSMSWLCLAEVDDVPARRDLLGRDRLVLGAARDLLGDDDVDGQDDPDALLLGGREDRARVLDPVGLGEALADRLALGEQERVGHPAADDQHVDLVEQVSMTLILSLDLGAADDGGERPLRVPRAASRAWRSRAP